MMAIEKSAVLPEHNFLQQMVIRSLKTAYRTLTTTQAFTIEVRNRALGALEGVFDLQMTETLWAKVRKLVLALSPKMEQSGFWSGWLLYLQRALQMSREFFDKQAEGKISMQIGIFQQRQGQLDKAREWFHESIECAKETDDTLLWATTLNQLGFMASMQHKPTEASAYVNQALELMSDSDLQQEYSYFILGNVSLSLNEPQTATNYFQKSIHICQQHKNQTQIASRYNSLGNSLTAQGMYYEALDVYVNAMKLW
ncbi:MAG: tetratricopeptide repeat protein, partial [Chloroflexota bacterium]